jgi:Bacterial mobilisation protein (MobC)
MKPVEVEFRKSELSFHRIPTAVVPTTDRSCREESYAQVESLVVPNSGGGLKPGSKTRQERPSGGTTRSRVYPLSVRVPEHQRKAICSKARAAGVSVNRFLIAAALGLDYRPPVDRGLALALLAIHRELAAQGNNLNQIARQLNAGIVLPGQGTLLNALAVSIQETHGAVRALLVRGKEIDRA